MDNCLHFLSVTEVDIMGGLFTIGHSKHQMDYFLFLLDKYKINYLLDVRSVPYSKYAEAYNRENLCNTLEHYAIRYWPMGKFFGARPLDRTLYTQEHYLDFKKARESSLFQKGLSSVLLGLRQENNIVMMCTEKDPFDCHRAIMVAKSFSDMGIIVKHILPDGSFQTQKELENRLLDKYFPERHEISLFGTDTNLKEEDYLEKCYSMRNAEIGYHIPEGD